MEWAPARPRAQRYLDNIHALRLLDIAAIACRHLQSDASSTSCDPPESSRPFARAVNSPTQAVSRSHIPHRNMKMAYATEVVGTYFLVLTVGLTSLAQTPFAPLAIGCSLMIMVYMGGHVSGAHYNPAVTLAVWMRGKLPARDVVPYWIAQLLDRK